MSSGPKRVVVLGSTGSIGRSTLDVARSAGDKLQILGITAHANLELAVEQAQQFRPRWLVATDTDRAAAFDWSNLPAETELVQGRDSLRALAGHVDADVVVSAIVGAAGLEGTWAALESGKTVALANKETLVVAGQLAMQVARDRGATILPVDSEHNAIFQALACGPKSELQRIILTASGGPFRNRTLSELADVTVEDALAHPTWDMGAKITIDSATMMNNALEVVEARWLFDVEPNQIDVVIHPQSIVHSLVEYVDGSVLAQLSPPDMRLPIQYALSYPERWDAPADRLDISQAIQLDFEPPDEDKFPALSLGHEVDRQGGTSGAVLNAAKEEAVNRFMNGEIRFPDITEICRAVLNNHDFDPSPSLETLFEYDAWARKEVRRWT